MRGFSICKYRLSQIIGYILGYFGVFGSYGFFWHSLFKVKLLNCTLEVFILHTRNSDDVSLDCLVRTWVDIKDFI